MLVSKHLINDVLTSKKPPLLFPNQFFNLACADSTMLLVVLTKCQT